MTQLVVILVAATAALAVSLSASYSLVLGGGTVFLANAYFGKRMARDFGTTDGARFLRGALVAEVTKLAITATLCVVVFVWVKSLHAPMFFTGMILALLASRLGLNLLQKDINPAMEEAAFQAPENRAEKRVSGATDTTDSSE